MLQYTDRKGVARLNIMNAMLDDAGEYTCEAVNAAGKDFTHCTVKVVGMLIIQGQTQKANTDMGLARTRLTPSRGSRSRSGSPMKSLGEERAPVITRPLSDATVTEGNQQLLTVSIHVIGNRELLEVEVSGNPEPMIEWYHDGKLAAESRTLRTYFDGRVAFLKIYQAQSDHQGVYVCKVSNKLGAVECRATLVVESARESEHVPKMPAFVKKIQDVVVNNVRIFLKLYEDCSDRRKCHTDLPNSWRSYSKCLLASQRSSYSCRRCQNQNVRRQNCRIGDPADH